MVLPQLEYLAPKTIGEACNPLLELGSPVKVMIGAADLIPPTKDKATPPECLIDLKKIPDLDYLEYGEEEGLKIGMSTTPRTIETSSLIEEKNPAVAHVAKVVASIQIRVKDTMVGNICDTSPPCDTAPNPLARRTKISVQGPSKDRTIQAEDSSPGVEKTSLEPGETVTGIVIPPLAENEGAAYIEHTVRKAMDLAIVGVAVKIKVKDGICTDAHIALGAVAATPIRAPKAEEALIGKALTDEVIVKTSEEVMDPCHPISDICISVEYRKDMIHVLTKRVIRQAMGCLQGGQESEA